MTDDKRKNFLKRPAEMTDEAEYGVVDFRQLKHKRFILKWSVVLAVVLFILIIKLAEYISGH